ncbi:equistatin-like [Clavelina lepadiformis]|uniref:equistatin-like n=1 Tax=Clavelina lepadiformis TaxID=159417 RepID=UPI004042D0E8
MSSIHIMLLVWSVLWYNANGDDLKPCEKRSRDIDEFMKNHPGIMDGPEPPQCDEDGYFLPIQRRSVTGACWCSKRDGTAVPGTLTRTEDAIDLDCCLDRHRKAAEVLEQNPFIKPKPWFPNCTEDGSWFPKQCDDRSGDCWCVDSLGNTVTEAHTYENGEIDCN